MKVTTTVLLGALAAQQAVATWDLLAPIFNCPTQIPHTCDEKEKGGFKWDGLQLGVDVGTYNGYQFPGFKCSSKLGKRDLLSQRTFQDKCITGKVTKDKTASPKITCPSKDFSIKEFQVSVDVDTDVEFHYGMPDGSICKQYVPCKTGGSTVTNTQCGGAKEVTFKIPNKGQHDSCEIGFHGIDFYCDNPKPTPSPSPSPAPTSEAPSNETPTPTPAPSSGTPSPSGETPIPIPSGESPTPSGESPTPSGESPTPSGESPIPTSETLSPTGETLSPTGETLSPTGGSLSPTGGFPSLTGESPSITGGSPSLTGETLSPTGETLSLTGETLFPTGGSPSLTGGSPFPSSDVATPSVAVSSTVGPVGSSVVTGPSSVNTPSMPIPTANCPSELQRCINTFAMSKCKDNTDFNCYCKDQELVKEIIDCVDAWTDSDTIISEALSFFVGICAPYVPGNPAIVTECPTSITLGPGPTSAPGTPSGGPPPSAGITKAPETTIVPGGPAPVTTLTITQTNTVPCGCDQPESSSLTTTTITMTVPQVHFTTNTAPAPGQTGGSDVGLVPGAPAPVPANPTGSSPIGFGTSYVPTPTGSPLPTFTGAAIKMGSSAYGLLAGAFLAALAL